MTSCPKCDRDHPGKPCLRGVVIACGGRSYKNKEVVWNALDRLNRRMVITELRHGACGCDGEFDASRLKGADRFADEWAIWRGVPTDPMPAWWSYGRSAGPTRNKAMLDKGGVVVVVAFPGGAGTAGMVSLAKQRGVYCWLVSEPPPASAS